MRQGKEVGGLARQLYPIGMLVTPAPGKTAAKVTEALMAESSTEVLFEAIAIAGHLSAKADIIQRDSGGWHVLEVKSSFADTGNSKNWSMTLLTPSSSFNVPESR
jgi:hypothetical protein